MVVNREKINNIVRRGLLCVALIGVALIGVGVVITTFPRQVSSQSETIAVYGTLFDISGSCPDVLYLTTDDHRVKNMCYPIDGTRGTGEYKAQEAFMMIVNAETRIYYKNDKCGSFLRLINRPVAAIGEIKENFMGRYLSVKELIEIPQDEKCSPSSTKN